MIQSKNAESVAARIAELLKRAGDPCLGGAWEGEIEYRQAAPGKVVVTATFTLQPAADEPTIIDAPG
jgi:hypothetical protein